MAAPCDDGVARRARTFVRDNDVVSLAALALLHAVHSLWMVVLLLGLDGRVHLGREISAFFTGLPLSPGVLASASVIVLYAGRVLARRLISKHRPSPACSVVRIV